MNEEIKLNPGQMSMLKHIMQDKYAAGPFTGMVFNNVIASGKDNMTVLKQALDLRILMENLVKNEAILTTKEESKEVEANNLSDEEVNEIANAMPQEDDDDMDLED